MGDHRHRETTLATFVLTTGNQLPPGASTTVAFRVNLIDRGYFDSGFPNPIPVIATASGFAQAAGAIIP